MRYIKFVLLTSLYILLVYYLNNKHGNIPPIGKFLSPYTGFLKNAAPVKESHEIHIQSEFISKDTRVVFDENNIPHIFATNETDLYYLQGYITARDRLWQMDLQTRVAAGRLSEIIGPKTLNLDREKRRNGLKFAAEKAVEKMMAAGTKEVVTAYTQGVNDYILSLGQKDLPLEFKLLDYQPEKWSPERSALLLKLMAERLTAMEADIENTNFKNYFGKQVFDLLFPNYVAEQSPIIPRGTQFDFNETNILKHNSQYHGSLHYKPIELPNRNLGSNNWAIARKKSITKNPILCNDPHLFLNYPSVWYEMHLVCNDLNVYGVTMPGAPGIIIGFNGQIAWGLTNAGRDVRNWYAIEYQDKNRNNYKHDHQWKKIEKRIETIKIRGQAPFMDTVLYTHHGPIVYDASFNNVKDKIDLALTWTAHQPSNELMTFYLLNHAKNHKDYVSAIEHFMCPGQNFIFASSTGDIAIKQQGLFPKTEMDVDKFVLDGTNKENDMDDFIPMSHNPAVLNPERGFVSSANQHPTDETYPYYYSSGEFEYNRSRRINEILGRNVKFGIQDMILLQQDEFNFTAADLLPNLVLLLDSNKITHNKYLNALKGWNFTNSKDSKQATYFELWLQYLKKLTWDELYDKKEMINIPDNFILSQLIKHQQNIDLFDYKITKKQEGISDIVNMAFDSMQVTMDKLEQEDSTKSRWANYKGTEISHMAKIIPFGRYEIQIGGNANIINAVGKTWGPSWRMIVELTPKGPKGFGIYPGGQSGNPGSIHYDEYTEMWRLGQYRKLYYVTNVADLKNQKTTIYFKSKKS